MVYESLEDWGNALLFEQKSLAIKQILKDSVGQSKTCANIANLFYYQKKYDSSFYYNKKALAILKLVNDDETLSNVYLAIGNYFQDIKKYDSAALYLNQALLISQKGNNNQSTAVVLLGLINNYINIGNATKAFMAFKESEKYNKSLTDIGYLKDINLAMFKYYKLISNNTKALQYLEKYTNYRDTLQEQSKNLEHQKIAIKYDLGKKVVADSLFAEQKIFVANNKTIKTRNSLLIVALLLVVALAIAIILYNRSKLLKRKNIIAEQEKQIAEQLQNTYQLKTLQAQMNPHFVFNCFSTIDSFIIQNKQLEASQLVQRFSKLSRRILEQTLLNYISIEEELETLDTYMQIERTRSSNKFNFSIEKQENLLQFQIPPMLLQPFVENAVIHGVRHLQKIEGLIKISLIELENDIQINIEDNGIGREKANEIKQQNTSTHRSISMDLTLTRLKSLHQNREIKYLEIIDLEGDITGTILKVTIPKITANA